MGILSVTLRGEGSTGAAGDAKDEVSWQGRAVVARVRDASALNALHALARRTRQLVLVHDAMPAGRLCGPPDHTRRAPSSRKTSILLQSSDQRLNVLPPSRSQQQSSTDHTGHLRSPTPG